MCCVKIFFAWKIYRSFWFHDSQFAQKLFRMNEYRMNKQFDRIFLLFLLHPISWVCKIIWEVKMTCEPLNFQIKLLNYDDGASHETSRVLATANVSKNEAIHLKMLHLPDKIWLRKKESSLMLHRFHTQKVQWSYLFCFWCVSESASFLQIMPSHILIGETKVFPNTG